MNKTFSFSTTNKMFNLLGFILLLIGIFLLTTVNFEEVTKGKNVPLWILPTFLSIFVVFGVFATTFRKGTTINTRKNLVTTWWGFICPLKKRHHQLSELKNIKIVHENQYATPINSSNPRKIFVYRLYLYNDSKSVPLVFYSKHASAEEQALHLKTELNLAESHFIDKKGKTKTLKEALAEVDNIRANLK